MSPCHFSGGGKQALAQEGQARREDGQLARLGVSERPVHSEQVAQVEQLDQAPAQVAHLLLADEDLDSLGPVAKLKEDHLPLPPPEHDPPRYADRGPGLGLLTIGSFGTGSSRTVAIAWWPSKRCPQGSSPRSAIRRNFSNRTVSRLSRGSSGIAPPCSFKHFNLGNLEANCSDPAIRVNGNREVERTPDELGLPVVIQIACPAARFARSSLPEIASRESVSWRAVGRNSSTR